MSSASPDVRPWSSRVGRGRPTRSGFKNECQWAQLIFPLICACEISPVAEDLDLALCLTLRGLRIDQVTTRRAQTSARRRRTSPRRQWQFHHIGLRTIEHHGFSVRLQHRLIILAACLFHTAQWPIYRF